MKARGRGWRGRACRAVVKVARRTGGRGEPRVRDGLVFFCSRRNRK